MKPYEQIIAYAKQIAVYRGYPDLVNGLQPVERLERKYYAEWQELRDAVYHKSRLHQLHEAADVYYYSAQLQEQTGQAFVASSLASLHTYHIDQHEVEAAALAKYAYRTSAPNNKDEQHELLLIEAAIQKHKAEQ